VPSDVLGAMGDDDARLVAMARQGSSEAATTLFRRHWLTVWQVTYAVLGRREAADDAAQEAMISAFASFDRFDESRPLGPWLKRIAFNRAIDEVRRRPATTDSARPSQERSTAEEAPELREKGPIAAAVARLAPERRTIIVLHYWLDHTRDEIAEILDLPPGTVASRLGRALTELRSLLEEEHVH
jgi:RNA polymerase sigma-70 factor, ECF subfamily